MSWDEIRKAVNSNLNVPLNHLIWLNDYKTYGVDSYVFQDKDIWNELTHDFILTANDSINENILEILISTDDSSIGLFFGSMYGIRNIEKNVDWNSLHNITDIMRNVPAVEAIARSPIGEKFFIKYLNLAIDEETTMDAYCASNTLLRAMYNNYNAENVNSFLSSTYLLNSAQKSPLYNMTSVTMSLVSNNASARHIHYNNKVLILGMSQTQNNTYGDSVVTVLGGTVRKESKQTTGTTGLVWRINKFAPSANCHTRYYNNPEQIETTSYMAYLKIE